MNIREKKCETSRIWRSPYSSFGELLKIPDDLQDETLNALQVYDDDTLKSIAKSGFNAIWIYGLLQNIVPSEIFPEFGSNASIHLNNMWQLIKRAAKHGIKVFILMQPPRALDIFELKLPFYKLENKLKFACLF